MMQGGVEYAHKYVLDVLNKQDFESHSISPLGVLDIG